MILQLAVLLALAGLAIGSFLNVCIDRLAPKRLLWMSGDKDARLDIEIPAELFDDDVFELYKDNVYVTGKIIKNIYTGNLQIYIKDASQIIAAEEDGVPYNSIPWKEAANNIGKTVTLYGAIAGGGAKKQSLATPPSHCDNCQHKLSLWDNIPIFSYLFLRGRCRNCRARIPVRVLLVEVLSGAIFLIAYWRFGLSIEFALAVFWSCIFIIIIFMDYEHKLILNSITYPAMVIAIVLLSVDSFVPGVNLFGDRLFVPETSLYSGLIVAAVVVLPFFFIAFLRPNSMGWGDVKLVILIALISGFPFIVSSLLIGVLIGGMTAIVIMAIKIVANYREAMAYFRLKQIKLGMNELFTGRKEHIAYGTFLAMGPIIALLADPYIMNWYLGFVK
jgi:prepilin signal peptidase PulO-like enzyme (type II secretory pathway)